MLMDVKGEGFSMQMISQVEAKLYDKPKEDWVGDSNFKDMLPKHERSTFLCGSLVVIVST